MGIAHGVMSRHMLQYLSDEYLNKKAGMIEKGEWKLVSHGTTVPQQENTDDCGVFMCMFAKFLLQGLPLNFFGLHEKYFIIRMAHELLVMRVA